MNAFTLTIDGQPVTTAGYFSVRNPSNGEPVGRCPVATAADVDAAVAAAAKAAIEWGKAPSEVWKAACNHIADKIERHSEELARLLTLEQSKPLNGLGSRFELQGAVAWARATAGLDMPVEVLQDNADGRIELHRKPVWVVVSITPWNWPLMIAIWHIVPAIRAGNTVVIKPSPFTPLSTLRLVSMLNEVLPPGVLNAVAGQDDIGPMLTAHPGVTKVVFTGSTATGRRVAQSAAPTLKRVTLELGGNDAGIVLPDADPERIADGVFWGSFVNSGQTCAALKRLYVHSSIYDAVCEALVKFAGTIRMGDGSEETSLLGPVQNAMQFEKVVRLVEAAKQAGARVLTGGEPLGHGYFYPVTLLADARDGMAVVDEEQFGPVLPIIRYDTVDEAIERANASESGLGGSVWSSDSGRAKALAQRLECGSCWINKHGAVQPNIPFGGVKTSGIGVEFGQLGLEEYTTVQVVYQ